MKVLYDHYSDCKEWFWANFTPEEIACKGTGELLVDYDAMDKLQRLREVMRRPLLITSAYRSPLHNAKVGGAPLSKHKEGIAFDISIAGHDKVTLYNKAMQVGLKGFGLNYKTFIHVDDRKEYARW